MAAETTVLLFLTFFQLAGALALAQRKAPHAEASRLLAALLVLNATISGIRALEIEGGASRMLDATRALVDLPSALLILAVVFALRPEGRLRRAAIVVGAVSLLHPLVALIAPPLLTNYYVIFFAIPYHIAVAALIWVASKGKGAERWIALAFLPRALYFVWLALQGTYLAGIASGNDHVYKLTIGIVAIVCGVAIARLGRWSNGSGEGPPLPMPFLVLAILVGPIVALAQMLFRDPVPPGIILLDLVTLSLMRPALLYVGLLPGRFSSMLINSVAAAGVGALVVNVTRNAMGFPGAAAALLGFAFGLTTLALADFFAAGRRPVPLALAPEPQSPQAPASTPEADQGGPDAATESGMPHWQRLVIELRGSSSGGLDGPGHPEWTQKELALRTGISVKRVSEFSHLLNSTAEARLDAHVRGWREQHKGRVPELVEVHRGAVRGLAGARVFYRLTPWGERLAEALADEGGRVAEARQETTPAPEFS